MAEESSSPQEEVLGRISDLAEAIVLADTSETAAVRDLVRRFQGIALAWPLADSRDRVRAVAACLQQVQESCEKAEKEATAENVVSVLSKAAKALQSFATITEDRGRALEKFWTAARPFAESAPEDSIRQADNPPFQGDAEFLGDFVEEAREHLDGVDSLLLRLEQAPEDSDSFNELYRAFHTIKGVAVFLGLEDITLLAHATESLFDSIRQDELAWGSDLLDLAFDAADCMRRLVDGVSESLSTGKGVERDPRLSELLDRLRQVDETSPEAEPDLAGNADQDASEHEGVASRKPVQESGPTRRPSQGVRVDARRLDRLVDAIGELVVAVSLSSRVEEALHQQSSEEQHHLQQVEKMARELQELGTSLRMIPLRSTFRKMARHVRDMSKSIGKPVELDLSGEDTELDRAIVDKIHEPLVHLLRNAIDHGIEQSPAERRARGKDEKGRIELRAFHRSGNIYIEVEDDGRGIDYEKVLTRARERKLVDEDAEMSPEDLCGLIFEPSFSTASRVTDFSGRGVGMYVVKRTVEDLRGTVAVESKTGKGAVVSMSLPLTIAMIDGMLITAGRQRFIIPAFSITRAIRVEADQVRRVSSKRGKKEMLLTHGNIVPFLRLGSLLDIADAVRDVSEGTVLILDAEGYEIALLTDEIIGQQQVVIKPLGKVLRNIEGVSGGAILRDGSVGLMLDVPGLLRLATFSRMRPPTILRSA